MPSFDSKYNKYINYANGGVISFVDLYGRIIKFTISSKNTSGAYDAKCCQCWTGCTKTYCESTGTINGISDTERNGYNALLITVNADEHELNTIKVILLDYYNTVTLTRGDTLGSGYPGIDTTFTSITLGAHTYYNVYTYTMDTLAIDSQKVWRVYVNDSVGVIAFDDRTTHSTYYLQ